MSDIQVFNNPQFGTIRTAGTSDSPTFCLIDLCKILDLGNPSQVKARLEDGVISNEVIQDSLGRLQNTNFVNEDGLYDVILDSRKQEARMFRKWVTSEVLPSIRKHGAYATEATIESIIANPDNGIKLLMALKEERQQRQLAESKAAVLEEVTRMQQPKVEHHDIFMNAEHGDKAVSVRKFIAQAGINGEKKFWHWMEYEVKGMIYRDSKGRPMPYAGKYRSIFAMPDTHNDKNDWSGTQLMVTPIGKVELAKLYYRDHPENFYTNSSVITSNLFNKNN